MNSRKFAVASDSSTQRQPLDKRPCFTPSESKRPDLVAVVAPMCIKGFATRSDAITREILAHRTGDQPNFALTEFSELCQAPVLYDRTSYVRCRERRVAYIRQNQGCFRARGYGGYHVREEERYMGRSSMGAYKKIAGEERQPASACA
jgi:hypothetical protein